MHKGSGRYHRSITIAGVSANRRILHECNGECFGTAKRSGAEILLERPGQKVFLHPARVCSCGVLSADQPKADKYNGWPMDKYILRGQCLGGFHREVALAAGGCAAVWRSDRPHQFAADAFPDNTFLYYDPKAFCGKRLTSYLSSGDGLCSKRVGQRSAVLPFYVSDFRTGAAALGCGSILCDPYGK